MAASLLLVSTAAPALAQSAVGTDFTYQGKLQLWGAPVSGTADLQFRLFDSSTGGNQIGSTQSFNNVGVADGLFTSRIDFGIGAFNGDARFLEIAVRSPAGAGNFVVLNPRQAMTAAPYAMQTRGVHVDGLNQVGLGTAAPQRSLHVAAPQSILRLQSTFSGAYSITEYQTDASVWQTGVGGSAVGNPLSGAYYIYDFGAQQTRMIVDGDGRVGIGIGMAIPQSKLDVLSVGAATINAVNNSWATQGIGVKGVGNSHDAGIGVYGIATATTGINYGVIGECDSPGGYDFYAAGPGINYGSTSSRRWKHNVAPISDPLRKLAQMRGVYFDWDEAHGGSHDVGMIAEEVGAVLPEIVAYEENGIDASGMDYSKLTPLLVEAAKEQQRQIEEQRSQMEALRQVNAGLRGQVVSQVQELAEMRDQLTSLMKQMAAMGPPRTPRNAGTLGGH